MRKVTVRNGMRLVLASLILIILSSFYHGALSSLFLLSVDSESQIYRSAIFWAAAVGACGVVMTAFGLAMSPARDDRQMKLLPLLLMIAAAVSLFFYLVSSSLHSPGPPERLKPNETITI